MSFDTIVPIDRSQSLSVNHRHVPRQGDGNDVRDTNLVESSASSCDVRRIDARNTSSSTTESITIDTVWKSCAYGEFQLLQELVQIQSRQSDKNLANKTVKAILDSQDDQGYSCLQWAALNDRTSIVSYLLEQGVEVNAQDPTGQTALHWAAVRGSLGSLDMLLRGGANPSNIDSKGYSVCHVAAQYGQTSIIYHLYIKWGIDTDLPDNDGRTPLHWACYKGFRDTVKLLIVMGADVMKMDAEDCTPLHWAAIKGHTDASMALLQGGAEDALESTDASGCTPSQLAIDKGHRGLGLRLAEYRYHKESRSSHSACSFLTKLHLAPVIWGIIITMLVVMTLSVVLPSRRDGSLFSNSSFGVSIGTWMTYMLAIAGLVFLYKTTVADPGFLPQNQCRMVIKKI